jgi:hypothetical protein
LLAVLASTPLHADPCDALPKPSVKVERLPTRLALNTTYSIAALNNIGASVARPGHQVLGLTRGTASASLGAQSPSLLDGRRRWECVSPQITLRYGFSPMTVYVAREFPPGTCAHKEIHEHEMRHVKTYEDHLATIEQELLETLSTRFATGTPWRGPAGEVSARLQRELDQRWLPYIQRRIKSVEEAQALIDTDEEYARVADACNGEIRKRLR